MSKKKKNNNYAVTVTVGALEAEEEREKKDKRKGPDREDGLTEPFTVMNDSGPCPFKWPNGDCWFGIRKDTDEGLLCVKSQCKCLEERSK